MAHGKELAENIILKKKEIFESLSCAPDQAHGKVSTLPCAQSVAHGKDAAGKYILTKKFKSLPCALDRAHGKVLNT